MWPTSVLAEESGETQVTIATVSEELVDRESAAATGLYGVELVLSAHGTVEDGGAAHDAAEAALAEIRRRLLADATVGGVAESVFFDTGDLDADERTFALVDTYTVSYIGVI